MAHVDAAGVNNADGSHRQVSTAQRSQPLPWPRMFRYVGKFVDLGISAIRKTDGGRRPGGGLTIVERKSGGDRWPGGSVTTRFDGDGSRPNRIATSLNKLTRIWFGNWFRN
ncbi:hypothetical protein KFK09_022056 [Dendrobium nobile]|uniref:Uncharacterized protein n=1 Tax=Dendrobium nobile TaxID=94219 RepID=A0A8T3AHU0_DENNO|nr:hypothetical protein KFK09_022056 [Dendrobium nobile]